MTGRRASKPRLLFVVNSLAGGGAERVMHALVSHFAAWEPDFAISLALLDDEPIAYAPPPGLDVHQLNCRGSLPRSIVGLLQLSARLRPHLIVSFLTRANVANVVVSRLRGRPALISERTHTSQHFAAAPPLARLVVERSYPAASRVIAVSGGVAEDLASNFGVPTDRIVVIPNPVDAHRLRSWAQEAPQISCDTPFVVGVGRLTPSKNFPLLLDAFARADAWERLVILGEGPERQALEARASALGLADRVAFPGFLANPHSVVARASVFVLSSNEEGFPNALVEAMALGVPVVATDCPAGPAEILHGARPGDETVGAAAAHGILTPCGDPAAMAAALVKLTDDDLRRDYADRAREGVTAYRPSVIFARYVAEVRGLLAQHWR